MLSDRCLSVCLYVLSGLSVCHVRALWPNGWTDQDETWHAGRPRPWPHCVRRGTSSPSPAHLCCGQMAAWIKMSLGMELGLSPGDSVLDGDPAPTKGVEPPPQLSAHFYCVQTAGCIKMPLGMEVGLSPGDFVLDGDPAPYPKRGGAQFSAHVYCGQTAAWIKMPLGTKLGLGLHDTVFDVDPASPKKTHSSLIFYQCLLWPNG